jgi:hypothetical protein
VLLLSGRLDSLLNLLPTAVSPSHTRSSAVFNIMTLCIVAWGEKEAFVLLPAAAAAGCMSHVETLSMVSNSLFLVANRIVVGREIGQRIESKLSTSDSCRRLPEC